MRGEKWRELALKLAMKLGHGRAEQRNELDEVGSTMVEASMTSQPPDSSLAICSMPPGDTRFVRSKGVGRLGTASRLCCGPMPERHSVAEHSASPRPPTVEELALMALFAISQPLTHRSQIDDAA